MPTQTLEQLEQSMQQVEYHLREAAAIIDELSRNLDCQRQKYDYVGQECERLLWNYRQARACLSVYAAPVVEPKKVVDLPPFLQGGNC